MDTLNPYGIHVRQRDAAGRMAHYSDDHMAALAYGTYGIGNLISAVADMRRAPARARAMYRTPRTMPVRPAGLVTR